MTQNLAAEMFFAAVRRLRLHPRPGNLRFYLENFFSSVPLEGKAVLDVGGGAGLFCFYAASQGARLAVCMEPAASGSDGGFLESFQCLQAYLRSAAVEFAPEPLEAFDPGPERFDVLVLHNSINHLDEPTCTRLPADKAAREAYGRLFRKIAGMSAEAATIMVADCAPSNLYSRLGLKNPFMPEIEWHKHQQPETWIALLREAGFGSPSVHWTSFSSLRGFGRTFLANRKAAYLLMSHFCLRMQKTRER